MSGLDGEGQRNDVHPGHERTSLKMLVCQLTTFMQQVHSKRVLSKWKEYIVQDDFHPYASSELHFLPTSEQVQGIDTRHQTEVGERETTLPL